MTDDDEAKRQEGKLIMQQGLAALREALQTRRAADDFTVGTVIRWSRVLTADGVNRVAALKVLRNGSSWITTDGHSFTLDGLINELVKIRPMDVHVIDGDSNAWIRV